MFLLKTVSATEAAGATKEAIDFFKGNIPLPLLQVTSSEWQIAARMNAIGYYSRHPRLSPGLLAAIRLRSAVIYGAGPCVSLNTGMLKSMGMGEDSLKAVQNCELPKMDDLEENERLMLGFVSKALTTPEGVGAEDIAALRKAGWEDGDIMDALLQGESMHSVALVGKVFDRP